MDDPDRMLATGTLEAMTPSHCQPYREPLSATLARTGAIALVIGAALAHAWGGWTAWPRATLLALWPALGGHFVELWFLNWLRPRLDDARFVQAAARLIVWFIAGVILALCMQWTAAAALGRSAQPRWPWWIGGGALIVIELIAHLVLQLRGRPSFYNGRG